MGEEVAAATRELPRAFRSSRVRRLLSIAGIGFAISSVAAAMVRLVAYDETLAFGCSFFPSVAWAALLLWQYDRQGQRYLKVRFGFTPLFAMLPMLLAWVTAFLRIPWRYLTPFSLRELLSSVVLFPGGVVWVPGTAAVLLWFAWPIFWGRRRAQSGFRGEDRASALLGLLVAIPCALAFLSFFVPIPTLIEGMHGASLASVEGLGFVRCMSAIGLLSGVALVRGAISRTRARDTLLRSPEQVGAGTLKVRVDGDRRVLSRVVVHGEGYRGASQYEDIADVDADGEIRLRAKD
jgi:hypothetical protein